jgi:hypothetical protein
MMLGSLGAATPRDTPLPLSPITPRPPALAGAVPVPAPAWPLGASLGPDLCGDEGPVLARGLAGLG